MCQADLTALKSVFINMDAHIASAQLYSTFNNMNTQPVVVFPDRVGRHQTTSKLQALRAAVI